MEDRLKLCKCQILITSSLFLKQETTNEKYRFKKLKKHEYLIQTWPDKMFQSTVVNRTLTGPLKTLIYATFRPPPH